MSTPVADPEKAERDAATQKVPPLLLPGLAAALPAAGWGERELRGRLEFTARAPPPLPGPAGDR